MSSCHLQSWPRARERGAVIVLVLVTLLLAAFLLAAFIRRSATEILADVRAQRERELRMEACSAVETALAIVAAQREAAGRVHRIDPDWIAALARSGYQPAAGREVVVEFFDESGLVSLPRTAPEVIAASLARAGLDPVRAEAAARQLHAWMHPLGAAATMLPDAPDYSRHEPPYRPPGRALVAWTELAAVERDRGLWYDEEDHPTTLTRALMRDFSLQAFDRSNLNSASGSVMEAMGFGPADVRAVEARRAAADTMDPAWRSSEEAAAALGVGRLPLTAGTEIEYLRVTVRASQGAVHYRLSVVVRLTGPAPSPAPAERNRVDYPFTVLEIREDLEAPELTDTES